MLSNQSYLCIQSHRNSTAVISSYSILVNSSLNLIQLGIQSDSAGSPLRSIRSFRDVICDHTQLETFLLVPNRHYIRLLSRRLCLLERKDLYHLFDLAQENIHFVAILEQLSTVLRSVGLADHQQHVENIIAMIGTIDRANIFRSVGALRNTSWMYDMPSLLGVLRSGEIDVSTLMKIVSDIEPMFFDGEDDGDGLAAALDPNHRAALSAVEKLQQQQLEYLMQFYNADDSTLRSIADWSFGGGQVKPTTSPPYDFPNRSEDTLNDRFKSFKTLGDTPIDLDAMESQQAASSISTDDNANSQNAGTSSSSANIQNESLSRKFLPKLIGNMDRLIDGTERFTKTPQWESLLSAFQGLQMLLEMAADETSSEGIASKNKLSSMNIETFILNLPKKLQALNTFFNSLIPEKLQPLLYPLFNLFHRASDSMLQHLSGAFSRALAEDKIYYFDRFAQLLLSSLVNGSLPRKCVDIQQAMCHFETFQSVFIVSVDEETGESSVLFEGDQGTLQGIQELGCLFFGHNYWQDEAESTPILAKLYYTLSTLNDTNLLASLASATAYLDQPNANSTSSNSTYSESAEEDKAFWTNFTSRMLEVYLLATKSVPATTWENIWRELRSNWKSNSYSDRAIFFSRILQLSTDCFIPNRIVQSSIWRAIYRKNAILHELLNVLLDEINTSAESEALKVTQMAMGSPTLATFLQTNLLPVFPSFIEAAFETVLFHLPHFVERTFTLYPYFAAGWPCSRASLLDVLTFTPTTNRSAVTAIESFLCQQMKLRPGGRGRIVDELLQPANNESTRIAPLILVSVLFKEIS